MTEGQRLALDQVRDVVSGRPGVLELVSVQCPDKAGGNLLLTVSVPCAFYPRKSAGLPLRKRERLEILIPYGFPFKIPSVNASHRRFAGYHHVQWGSHLCLYLAPDSEWDPSDGMLGFLDRLDEWLAQGALGELDPVGAPIHPPVAYPKVDHVVIPRVDTPEIPEGGWHGFAVLRRVSERRTDIVGWVPCDVEDLPESAGAAILLDLPLTFFEFPHTVAGLLLALVKHGVALRRILLTLQWGALRRGESAALLVVIGSPMRGIAGTSTRQQHLVAWLMDEAVAQDLVASIDRYFDEDEKKASGEEAEERFWEWAKGANARWCGIREDRPEVTVRRDHDSPSSWFRGKTVAIWGCGALGGYVAEFVVRGGARKAVLVDESAVAPGILVRQPFTDQDIGENKAVALAGKLRAIFPTTSQVEGFAADVVTSVLEGDEWHEGFDLVIDCTASRTVLKKLEQRCSQLPSLPVSVASLVVGTRASQGLVTLAREGFTGGPGAVLRKAKLHFLREGPSEVLEEFWPGSDKRRQELFQPEPGCSDITFVGAATDVAGLAASMLNLVAADLSKSKEESGSVHWVLPPRTSSVRDESATDFCWPSDEVIHDESGGYQVRVTPDAWSMIRDWITDSRRRRGRRVETGGVLFGQRDDAARVIWVDEAMGPPLDSEASEEGFLCGTIGVQERDEQLNSETNGTTRFVGMWHTHPDGIPSPSTEDHLGVGRLLALSGRSTERVLMLIIGGDLAAAPEARAYSYSRRELSVPGSQSRLRVRALYPVRLRIHNTLREARSSLRGVSEAMRSLARTLRHLMDGD